MELRQLRYMLMVAEEKNFSRAAEKLYIAQPHLSQSILKLEKQMGVRLFDRTTTPVKLTYAGELFAAKARQMLNLQEELSRQMEDIVEDESGRLSIGISTIRGSTVLPVVLPAFHELFPKVEISLREGTSQDLENWLNKGITDLTITNLPLGKGEFSYEVILEEEVLLATAPQHPLAEARKQQPTGERYVELRSLSEEPFILLHQGQGLRHIADLLFLRAGFQPKILLETRSSETALGLAAAGMGLTFSSLSLDNPLARGARPVYLRIADYPFMRTLVVVHRKEKYFAKYEREFIRIIRQVIGHCGQEPSS